MYNALLCCPINHMLAAVDLMEAKASLTMIE